MSSQTDYYETLGLSRDADAAAIKASYRRLAMEFHPDKNGGCTDAEGKFKAVSEAYECLKDPQKRAAYDRFGHAAFQNGGFDGAQQGAGDFTDISDLFDTIFGGAFGGGQQRQRGPARGADLRYDLEITLDDAYHGKSTEIAVDVAVACDACAGSGAAPGTGVSTCSTCNGHGKVRAQQGFFAVERACPACHGAGRTIDTPCRSCRGEGRVDKRQTLTVEIPPGVDEGTRIRLSGRGEAGANGAPAGDLYIFLHVAAHPIFQREGTTLFARVPISFTTAALGDEIEVPGLDGKPHAIRIPAGIQSGKQLRQRGAGMPVLNGRGQGDMVVQIEVETPTKLSAKQKELLAAFRATETGDECPDSKGFFERMKKTFAG
ncbi:MAG: molecular chaperone DnaJ [Sphingomonadales bacterium]|nr:molecular chaperone DnaJ [Sphingomonadales bacterium]